MTTLTASTREKLGNERAARGPERTSAGRMLAGFGPRGATVTARDPLGGAALTMLLVLYPALASAIVAVAAFLFCSQCGAV